MTEEPSVSPERASLDLAEKRYAEHFNQLYERQPETFNFKDLSRDLIHGVILARLEMLWAAERSKKAEGKVGETLAPEFQQQVAECERAMAVVEGKKRIAPALIG